MTTEKPKHEIIVEKHDKNYYHARVKDTKYSADECDIISTIGRLVFEHQDFFNVKITVEPKDMPKKKRGGMFNTFNTNPGSSLPRSD
jgi:hypothetical protein